MRSSEIGSRRTTTNIQPSTNILEEDIEDTTSPHITDRLPLSTQPVKRVAVQMSQSKKQFFFTQPAYPPRSSYASSVDSFSQQKSKPHTQ